MTTRSAYLLRPDLISQLRHPARVPGELVDPLLVFIRDVHVFDRLRTHWLAFRIALAVANARQFLNGHVSQITLKSKLNATV